MSRINTLRNLILKAKHAYYYSNEPVMTDAEYDALEDELRLLDANDPVLALVGSPVPANTMLGKMASLLNAAMRSAPRSRPERYADGLPVWTFWGLAMWYWSQ